MRSDAGSSTELVHVRLLDEGTDVWRPTTAVRLADGRFLLLPTDDHDPATESWEFPPGSVVECELRGEASEEMLVVVRFATTTEAQHRDPIRGMLSDFIIAVKIDPGDTAIATEQLWARRVDGVGYEICCIPFFANDLALGDIVEVDADHRVQRVVTPSGRCVFRAFFDPSQLGNREDVLDRLTELGAWTEWSSHSMVAVDARDAAHGQMIADYLWKQEQLGRLVYETGRTRTDA